MTKGSVWDGLLSVGTEVLTEKLRRVQNLAETEAAYVDDLINAAAKVGLGGEPGGLQTKLIGVRDALRKIAQVATSADSVDRVNTV